MVTVYSPCAHVWLIGTNPVTTSTVPKSSLSPDSLNPKYLVHSAQSYIFIEASWPPLGMTSGHTSKPCPYLLMAANKYLVAIGCEAVSKPQGNSCIPRYAKCL